MHAASLRRPGNIRIILTYSGDALRMKGLKHAVNTGIRERLLELSRRLRAAIAAGASGQIVAVAQQCLVDIDCALAHPHSRRGRLLCAQAEALIATLATGARAAVATR